MDRNRRIVLSSTLAGVTYAAVTGGRTQVDVGVANNPAEPARR